MSQLKSLEDFNNARRQRHEYDHNAPRPNGIACPKCGS